MGKNSHLGFGYVPTSATIDRFDGEETSVFIGMPNVNNDTPIANEKGQNPYIPIEGLISGTENASVSPYFLSAQFNYESPDSEISNFASPYTYFEFEGIIASENFLGNPIHDFFRMSYTVEIPDPASTYSFTPKLVEILGEVDTETGIAAPFELLTSSTNTQMTYNGSGNNKLYNFRFGITGGTPGLSYNIRYTFL